MGMAKMALNRKYISMFKAAVQDCLAYRLSYLFNILAQFVSVFTIFYIWKALFNGRDTLNGYTWGQMRTYLFVTFGVNALISWYSESRVSNRIRDGSVAMDLLKPYDFQKAQLAGSLGGSVTEIAVALIFCAVLLPLFGGVSLPPDPPHAVCFLVSVVFSYLVKFDVVYIFSLICFYTTSSLGIRWARGAVTDLFSGALIPITFFPGPLLALTRILPFQGVVYIPVSIYMGTAASFTDMLRAMAFQAVWAAALWFLGKACWRVAVRQVTILGG